MLRSLVIIFSALLATCLGASVRLTPPMPDHRIVGGKQANIREHPHQASLSVLYDHTCGASIINKKWLISAAHCIHLSPRYYFISVGSNDTTNQIYGVKKTVTHPLFNSGTLDYDVSLIEVTEEIQFNDLVKPIELASKEPPLGLSVNVTGWGRLQEGGQIPQKLQIVSVPIVNRTICQKAYKGEAVVTPSMICAGYEGGGKDSCQGDSGGPLSANGLLYGIVSWGFGCARPNYPGVYTNVAAVRTWVKVMSKV